MGLSLDSGRHSAEYTEHLNSAAWNMIRQRKLFQVGGRCERCGTDRPPLQVHHLNYARLGHEELDDLLVVCPPCHATEDLERAGRTRARVWRKRVEGYAAKRWGEHWFYEVSYAEADEALREWIDELGEWA